MSLGSSWIVPVTSHSITLLIRSPHTTFASGPTYASHTCLNRTSQNAAIKQFLQPAHKPSYVHLQLHTYFQARGSAYIYRNTAQEWVSLVKPSSWGCSHPTEQGFCPPAPHLLQPHRDRVLELLKEPGGRSSPEAETCIMHHAASGSDWSLHCGK